MPYQPPETDMPWLRTNWQFLILLASVIAWGATDHWRLAQVEGAIVRLDSRLWDHVDKSYRLDKTRATSSVGGGPAHKDRGLPRGTPTFASSSA